MCALVGMEVTPSERAELGWRRPLSSRGCGRPDAAPTASARVAIMGVGLPVGASHARGHVNIHSQPSKTAPSRRLCGQISHAGRVWRASRRCTRSDELDIVMAAGLLAAEQCRRINVLSRGS